MSSFSELLTAYTERAGATDEDLAAAVGVRPATVARWRSGHVKRPRSQASVARIAAYLELTPAERADLFAAAGFEVEVEVGAKAEAPGNDAVVTEASAVDADVGAEAEAKVGTKVDSVRIGNGPGEDEATFAEVPVGGESLVSEEATAAASSAVDVAVARKARPPILPAWRVGVMVLIPALLLALLAGWWLRQQDGRQEAAQRVNVAAVTTVDPLAARPGEQLVLVAEFADLPAASAQAFAEQVQSALEDEMAQAALETMRVVQWPHVVMDAEAATEALGESGAAAIIWGRAWDDAAQDFEASPQAGAQVRVNIAPAATDALADPGVVPLLSSPDDLAAIVNPALPQDLRLLALLTLGRLYRAADAPEPARAALTRALELQPASPATEAMLHFLLATVAEQSGDPAGAIAEYGRVIPLRPDWVNPRYNRGRAYLHRYFAGGEPDLLDAAIAELSWTAHAVPALSATFLARGIAYYERNRPGDLDLAAADMTAALARAPNSAPALYHRGLLNIRRNDPQWRIDLERALALEPEDAATYAALCRGYMVDDRAARAATFCYRARELDPTYAATDIQGIVYAKLGRNEAAIDALQAYLDKLRNLPRATYVRQNGPQVEGWLEALQAGEMPFDAQTLAGLR